MVHICLIDLSYIDIFVSICKSSRNIAFQMFIFVCLTCLSCACEKRNIHIEAANMRLSDILLMMYYNIIAVLLMKIEIYTVAIRQFAQGLYAVAKPN